MKTFPLVLIALFTSVACGSSDPPPEVAPEPAPKEAPAEAPAAEVLASGTIELGMGAVADKATAVYVSLRGGPGPPLAAKKLPSGPFPMEFELTTADMPMRNGRPIPEKLTLKVALDGDDNPMTKDGLGEVVAEIDKGATGGTFKVTAPIPPKK